MSTSTPLPRRVVFWAATLAIGLLLTLWIVPFASKISGAARRAVDATHLRLIVQSNLAYATDHGDHLPAADDVWDYARLLADDADADDPALWFSTYDPAAKDSFVPTKILASETTKPTPLAAGFREIKPSVAVPLGKLHTRMPATTPIAWTRGLQPNGRWSPHSPYGTRGGYIAFLGGSIVFLEDLATNGGELVRFDQKGQTANILEALPAGVRIGEYVPTPEEQTEWSAINAWRDKMGPLHPRAPWLFFAVVWLSFIAISVFRLVTRQPGGVTVLLWPAAFSAAFWFITRHAW